MAKVTHHLVDFASRYARVGFPTLNASTAIYRAEALIDDAEELIELHAKCEERLLRFGHRMGTYEVVSYYAVGFITCLEWHARSRMVDLMMFAPDSIEANDVKNIEKNALSQMMSANVTVPHLVGAATKVANIQDYVDVFNRIYRTLKIDADANRLLRGIEAEQPGANESAKVYDVVADLFRTRHHLVHEIDLSIVGHFSIRDMWEPKDAVRYGRAILSCMLAVEKQITTGAPANFPNRLDAEGNPEDELAKVLAEIARLEAELSSIFGSGSVYETPEWIEALRASRASTDAERAFIRNSDFLRPIRHLDRREAFELALLKARLNYLKLIRSDYQLSVE